jgi:hypothetical protein
VRGMYYENRNRFLTFIKNTNFECMVLWTDSQSIVNYLSLRGVVHISWTGKETLYSVAQFNSTNTGDTTSREHPLVRRQRKQNETNKTSVTVLKREVPELMTDGKAQGHTEKIGDVPVDEDLLVPEMLSLTRMSSVAMEIRAPRTWGDMEADT